MVNLVKLYKNIGIAGWNECIKAEKGEFVLVLDDGAYPENSSLSKAIGEFYGNKKVACVTFNMYDLIKKSL